MKWPSRHFVYGPRAEQANSRWLARRESHTIPPEPLLMIFAASGPGALLGALFAGRIARSFGLGRTIISAITLAAASSLLVPLARGPVPVVVGMLMVSAFAGGVCNPVYNINQVSLRQAITPDRLLGRMNASMRFIVWGTIPLGALLGAWLGEAIGLWPTLMIAALGQFVAPLFVLLSPVRSLREQPLPLTEPLPAS